MNHLIIVKFKSEYSKEQISKTLIEIKSLFDRAKTIPGIHDVKYKENCIDRSNRYDFLINIIMDKDALSLWDTCEWHLKWKSDYGHMIESKCVFDFE